MVRATPLARGLFFATLALLPGCEAELAAFLSIAAGTGLGAWIVGRNQERRALYDAQTLRKAIGEGEQRTIEHRLRKQLALAAAGEAVSPERQWLTRAQLGGLLVAEWRLEEARDIYGAPSDKLSPLMQSLANFGRHEVELLTGSPSETQLAAIATDRDSCLAHVPPRFRGLVHDAWRALEGLGLARMGRAREAMPLLEQGLRSMDFNPARVVYLYHLGQSYEQLGERELAAKTYKQASSAFPGTRLASEAKSRMQALGPGSGEGMFRAMLPEAPELAREGPAPQAAGETDEDDG